MQKFDGSSFVSWNVKIFVPNLVYLKLKKELLSTLWSACFKVSDYFTLLDLHFLVQVIRLDKFFPNSPELSFEFKEIQSEQLAARCLVDVYFRYFIFCPI